MQNSFLSRKTHLAYVTRVSVRCYLLIMQVLIMQKANKTIFVQ